MSHENIIAILSILISAIVAVAGIVIAQQSERLRAMREQLSEKKCKAYADAMMIFYSVLKDSQLHRPTDNKAMMQKMIDTKKDIFNGKTKLTKHDILLNLMQSEEEARKYLIT